MMRSTSLLTLLATGLIATSTGCANERVSKENAEPPPAEQPEAKPTNVNVPATAGAIDRLPDIVEKTLPGVVGISTKRTVTMRRAPMMGPFGFFGQRPPMQREQEGMGSGVIVSEDGLILTNNHVIDGADEIVVQLSDGKEYDAKLVGADPKSDVAVVRLEEAPAGLRWVPFGDSDSLRLGEPVVAIGSPFGLSSTVTLGIVSAKGRENVGIVDYEDFIQTDAAINPGNSGGALVNLDGELVGINTAILSRSGGYQGIGFAIPANMVKSIKDSIVKHGKVTRGWLGVAIQTVTDDLAEAFDLPEDTRGVIVSDVEEDSPAKRGGLKRGDVVLKLNDRAVTNAAELRNAVALQPPGTHVGIEVLRNGRNMMLNVELGELSSGAVTPDVDALAGMQLGMLDEGFRSAHRIPKRLDGVAVMSVEPGSAAARLGLRPGDVIVELNRRAVDSPDDIARGFNAAKSRVLFLVYRDGRTLYLAMKK